MNFNQRALINNDLDISEELNNFRSEPVDFDLETSDYFYVAQEMPFNHLYFLVDTVNEMPAALSVDVWYANQWQPVVDLADRTRGLTRSGRVSFSTSWRLGWDWEDRAERITGLTGVEIYDMFWARLSWDANLSEDTKIKYVGQKFCSDADLEGIYPDMRHANVKTMFGGAGKTTWETETLVATQDIIDELKRRGIIQAKGQVLDWTVFRTACIHRTAYIIYHGLGTAYTERRNQAAEEYKQAMNIKNFRVDRTQDAKLSVAERKYSQKIMRR